MKINNIIFEPYIIVADNIRIIAVVQNIVTATKTRMGLYFSAYKSPVALVIVNGSFKKIFRISGEEITFELLVAEFPELASYSQLIS